MAKMKDYWGDTIELEAEDGFVFVSFTELRPHDDTVDASMALDAPLTRKLIKKLKKALAEVEDM